MKSFYKIGLSITIAILSLIVISFVNLSDIKNTPTGNFIFIGGYAGFIAGLGTLVPFVYIYWKEKKGLAIEKEAIEKERITKTSREKWVEAFSNLFDYSSSNKIDESKVYTAARELVYATRELADEHNVKLRSLSAQNAEHKAVQFADYAIRKIRHTTHVGTRYVLEMRRDLYDRKIDSPEIVDGALRFLSKMDPYGDVADDLERIFYRAIR